LVRAGAGITVVGPTVGVQAELQAGVRRLHIGQPGAVFDLAFEVGYVGAFTANYQRNLFAASVSPGVGFGMWAVRWAPRFLIGSANNTVLAGPAIGLRNELLVGYLRGLIEVSAGHSWLHNVGEPHAVHLAISLDVGLAFYAFLGFFANRTPQDGSAQRLASPPPDSPAPTYTSPSMARPPP
jgi:hypothetical protein